MDLFQRAYLVDRLWEKAEPLFFATKDEFINGLSDWDIYPVMADSKILLIVATNGPHMHFETMSTGRPITRRIVRQVLEPLIEKYGYAVTKTPKTEMRQRRFNELIGFVMVGEDEYDIHYRIERVRGGPVH